MRRGRKGKGGKGSSIEELASELRKNPRMKQTTQARLPLVQPPLAIRLRNLGAKAQLPLLRPAPALPQPCCKQLRS